jgi:hypothetical protein
VIGFPLPCSKDSFLILFNLCSLFGKDVRTRTWEWKRELERW